MDARRVATLANVYHDAKVAVVQQSAIVKLAEEKLATEQASLTQYRRQLEAARSALQDEIESGVEPQVILS